MKRVAIVGCPGSGKTTFTRKLAEKTKLPTIHLDYYYHQKMYDYPNNSEAWKGRVKELIAKDAWIMDGNYNSTINERFRRADTIIFFDYPRRKSLYGVLKRRIQYRNKLREEMPSDWKETASFEFLVFVWNFRRDKRGTTIKALEDNKNKEVFIFTNQKQAQEYLDRI